MIDRKALLNDLKQQVKAVETDLGRQVKALGDVGARLRAEYDQARKLGRTAATWTSWLDERVTQVAVAWVLGTVFVRFCEDNRLIPEPYLTGPDGDRRELAESRYDAYVESDEDPTYRGWLEKAFEELGAGQGGQLLFDRKHNPLFQIPLSHDGARELVEFWRGRDDSGALHHDFTDELNEDGSQGWDTRFLGDLYEHLSKTARDVYALRQTPEFVEEFILDRTMDPAVSEFGYEGLKMIDPTCGSGHFVLGAFHRLIRIWSERQAGKDVHERVRAALDSVHGVDLNPFAVAIARFRLLVAAMAASGVRTMEAAAHYEWPIHLAVGDSLIKSRQLELMLVGGEEDEDPLASFAYSTEDVHDHPDILRPGRYHVVVGNPPYITVKDKVLNALYRDLYKTCHLKYHLTAPFAERFFEIALRGDSEGRGYGLVGQITGNGFVKREFGAKLIEDYFAHQVELTEVIDTSGAHIPGHGTPTIIIIGRRRSGGSRSQTLRSVRSIQGEPSVPSEPKDGFVWKAIIEQIDSPGSISQWVAVDDLDRDRYFGRHPWVLVDGGLEMIEKLAEVTPRRLKSASEAIGYSVITGEDEAFSFPHPMASWVVDRVSPRKPFLIGDQIRDWSAKPDTDAIFPVNATPQQRNALEERHLWPSRQTLRTGLMFSKTKEQRGIHWSSFAFHKDERLEAQELICFSSIATTHNHFALVVEGAVPNHSAQVVMLRQPADTRAYVQLLGVLNSSVACCWLKMVSHNKGSGGIGGGIAEEHWEQFYEFTGSKLEEFPLPESYPVTLAAALEKHARQLGNSSPSATVAAGTPTVTTLREAQEFWHSTRARMIALQEELDWQVYSLYALHSEDLRVSENPDDLNIPDLALGERAFEIVLARRVAAGEASNEWFKRHNSTPITGIPAHWPAPYREVVQKRIEAIESNRAIGMVERSEYKRRWATEGWDALQEKALRTWLLERMENRDHWFDENGQPTILTLARLTDALSRDEDFVSVAKLYAPRKELAKVVAELITDEHVPFLSALRYKPSGLKKRADWEEVWDLQRKEDAAPDEPAKRKIRDSIPVPPKYTSADFLRPSYWRARGKLDVPKERFISYGQTNAATPELYGWAGWDHREQAQALATYFTNTALSTEEITPFLAGLLELQPWLSQWHNEFDMNYSGSPADFFAGYRQQKQGEHGLTDDDLRGWRPPAATRGRRAAVKP